MLDAVLMSAYGLHWFTHAGQISANIGRTPLLHSLQKIGPEAEVLKDTAESKGTYFYLTSVSHQKCIVLLMDLESSTNDHPDQSLRHYISTLSQFVSWWSWYLLVFGQVSVWTRSLVLALSACAAGKITCLITVSPRAHVQRFVTWKQFGVLPHVA